MTRTIGIPLSEYDMILAAGGLTDAGREAVARFLEEQPFGRILIFGAATTGRAVREGLGDRFAGFVETSGLGDAAPGSGDCVLICTSPVHAAEVERALADSPLSGLPVFRLFGDGEVDIRLIVETQPRCGTGYTMVNLTRSLGLGYASVFEGKGRRVSADGLFTYAPGAGNGYAVKAHFTKTLHYPQYRYVPTVYVTGYFPDTYYRWARMISGVADADRDNYYLSADSPEWGRVKGYVPLHCKWLDYIRSREYYRYEDYYSDFDGVMDRFERLLGQRPAFEPPRVIAGRIYWSGDHDSLMDREVWDYLKRAFAEPERAYYPEMAG